MNKALHTNPQDRNETWTGGSDVRCDPEISTLPIPAFVVRINSHMKTSISNVI